MEENTGKMGRRAMGGHKKIDQKKWTRAIFLPNIATNLLKNCDFANRLHNLSNGKICCRNESIDENKYFKTIKSAFFLIEMPFPSVRIAHPLISYQLIIEQY